MLAFGTPNNNWRCAIGCFIWAPWTSRINFMRERENKMYATKPAKSTFPSNDA